MSTGFDISGIKNYNANPFNTPKTNDPKKLDRAIAEAMIASGGIDVVPEGQKIYIAG